MNTKAEILIVDDEANTLASLSRAFRLAGHEATVCDNAARALELAKTRLFDLILSDVVMPGRDGLALLEDLRANGVTTPVVMMSGQAHIEMAVRATRLGALDFLEKPISTDKLLLTVENALKLKRLEAENRELRHRVGKHQIVWKGEAMGRVMAQIERVAASESRICIYGETGTGKELAARTLHEKSARAQGPFVTLNCAAVPPELIESELFGHEKGAFTGAAQRHVGKFEQAHRGTLLLDEIGDMPLSMQAKLLRVLEEGEVERIGGDKPVAVDVRVLVATHHDLGGAGRAKASSARTCTTGWSCSPSRCRRCGNEPMIFRRWSSTSQPRCVRKMDGRPSHFTEDAMESLESYPWPGNVRELRNMVERLLLLAGPGGVDRTAVELALPQSAKSNARRDDAGAGPLSQRVAQFERETILAELQRQHYHITNTAKALGLERSHLYKKCQHLGIELRPGH